MEIRGILRARTFLLPSASSRPVPGAGNCTVVIGSQERTVRGLHVRELRARPPHVATPRRRRVSGGFAVATICGAAVTWVAVRQPGPWAALVVLVAVPLVGFGLRWRARDIALAAFSLSAAAAVVDYLSWRAMVVNWSAWWLALPLLVAEAFGAVHAVGVGWTVWPRPSLSWRATRDATLQPVFVLIPTVNEGAEILTRTIDAALDARAEYLRRYRHGEVTIVVCNDGRVAGWDGWRDVQAVAEDRGVVHVARTVPGGAKAGNIENARQQLGITGDALIVVFDADQVAASHFLVSTIPLLDDERVAWVQTSQTYRNMENPVARWAEEQQAIFYQILCPGKARHNAAFICGTNVALRASALDEIGGFPQDTVTEDFAASVGLHARWRSVFVPGVLAEGLGPMDLASYLGQQRRWAIGTLSVLRTSWRQIFWRSGQDKALTMEQRIQYALAATHYLSGVKDLVFVVAPVFFLLTGVPAVRGSTLDAFLFHFLPYLVLTQAVFWTVAHGKTSWRGLLMGFISFPVLIGAAMAVVTRQRSGFTITSKTRNSRRKVGHVIIYAVGLAVCVGAVGVALTAGRTRAAYLISLFWIGYSLVSFAAALGLSIMDLRSPSSTQRAPGRALLSWLRVRRVGGARRLVLVASCLIVAMSLTGAVAFTRGRSTPAAAFEPARSSRQLDLGVDLPGAASLPSAGIVPGPLLDVIGRTQNVKGNFDVSWAQTLHAHGVTPWITLVFGDGRSDLNSSLPSITNGVHDEALRRWARQLREFAHPVYLTVLPQVDRQWPNTSAVADGGIPQDVAPAWSHIHHVFQDEGARNVAFVWAPADPIHDQAVAPAEDQIDAVMLTMLSYPGTSWAGPATKIAEVTQRHPHAMIMVEIGVAGQESAQTDWIRSVAAAARSSSRVGVLLYHQSPPQDSDDPRWVLRPESAPAQAFANAATAMHGGKR